MILLGTSGFSYDDWKGRWYPPGLAKAKMLDYYASVFDALEINATYYRTPGIATAQSMVKRAAGRLVFAIKAPGDVTHKRKIDEGIILPYRRFLEPLIESTTLAAVLLQFPNSFKSSPESWNHLQRTSTALAGLPLVAELRHSSFDSEESDGRLEEMGYSRSAVDQPHLKGMSESARVSVTGPIAYFRFHGRNYQQWYAHNHASDRYRYEYTQDELEPWVPRIRNASARAQTTMAFFNNHPDGGAPQNAEMMATLLDVPLRGSGYKASGDLFA